MRILIINCDYTRFLEELYAQHPGLGEAPYAQQMQVRNDSLFGVADFYSRAFAAHGHEAIEVHVNNSWMQTAWAREHGLNVDLRAASRRWVRSPAVRRWIAWARKLAGPLTRGYLMRQMSEPEARVLAAQIEDFRPDVILNQEMGYVRSSFLGIVRRRGLRIVGQIAAALPAGESFAPYDLVVSSLPNHVEWFRGRGVRAELNRLGFEPRVLQMMPAGRERDIPLSFVGSLSADHRSRIRLLESLARCTPLQVWGNGIETLPASSPLHRCYRGEAWGRAMYDVLLRSRVTINHHIDLAAGYANNMRLYEATGCGALMLVDAQRNLGEIFEPGREVVTYSSADECARQVEKYLNDETARAAIAAAGQRRTLTEHVYDNRARELVELFRSCA